MSGAPPDFATIMRANRSVGSAPVRDLKGGRGLTPDPRDLIMGGCDFTVPGSVDGPGASPFLLCSDGEDEAGGIEEAADGG